MPVAAIVVALIDLIIGFSILVMLMVWYRFLPGWQILLFPVFVTIAFLGEF